MNEMTPISQLPDMTSAETYRTIARAIEYLSMPGPEASDIAGLAHALSISEHQLVDMFRRWCGLTCS